MTENRIRILKNLHLIISVMIVIPAGIVYGTPSLLHIFLDVYVNTTDAANMLNAIMMLYLGISVVYLLGIFKPAFWQKATELNILFMFALASGRLLSMVVDGIPSDVYVYGVIGELILGLFSIYQLKVYGKAGN